MKFVGFRPSTQPDMDATVKKQNASRPFVRVALFLYTHGINRGESL